ncbi:MocR-like pyridoxine biosynthesis transcription factor PdxR [Nonomuraea jabiensis]|uniref:MocR-like pyridoxine biosynthesis transcription factor PdxR n=1 Tax=Nonomuraea jabiensis TaxID=882448 RepID=UPI0036C4565E
MTDALGPELLLELPGWGSRGRALEEALRSAIRGGRLVAGTRLPSSRDLASQLGLSRGTVTQAYEQLVAEGWLTARQGSGTRVAAGTAEAPARSGTPRARAGRVGVRSESLAEAAAPGRSPRHDLRPGRPDAYAFPREAWARAMRHVLREAPTEVFGFGDPRGRIELRTALASYLGRTRGVRVDPANLIVCSGYTQALGLLAEVFAELGVRTAGMEDPAIGDHVRLLAGRLRVAAIPVDAAGLRVDALRGSGAEVAVCTPAHQFPLGVSMAPERRSELLEWADDSLGWIVEDDYDGEFRYDRHPIAALQSRRPSRIVYAGSTSKTIGPAVRLGWIACPPLLLEPLTEAKRRARETRPLEQLALARMIELGDYDRHLRTMRRGYQRRRDTLVAAVRSGLPDVRVRGIDAGLHALLELPSAPSERAIVEAARAASVDVHPLGEYMRGDRDRHPPSLVVGYATPPAHSYPAALDALIRGLRRL